MTEEEEGEREREREREKGGEVGRSREGKMGCTVRVH